MNDHLAIQTSLAIGGLVAKSTLILILAWLVARILRKADSASRHLVWLAGFCAILMLPALTLLLPGREIPLIQLEQPIERPTKSDVPLTMKVEPTKSTVAPKDISLVTASDVKHLVDQLEVDRSITPAVPTKQEAWPRLALAFGGVWAAGMIALGIQWLLGMAALRRLSSESKQADEVWCEPIDLARIARQVGLTRSWDLRISATSVPPAAMTWGIVRPVVLLPKNSVSWSQERLEAVLLHELAHVRRFDSVSQFIAVVSCALYWFNPTVWLCARAMRAEAEIAADDTVIRMGVKPSDYARELLQIAADLGHRRQPFSTIGVPVMKQSKIESRVKAILDPSARRRRGVTRIEALAVAGIAIFIAVPLSSLRAAIVPANPPPVTIPALPGDDLILGKSTDVGSEVRTPPALPSQNGQGEKAAQDDKMAEEAKLAAIERARADLDKQQAEKAMARVEDKRKAQADLDKWQAEKAMAKVQLRRKTEADLNKWQAEKALARLKSSKIQEDKILAELFARDAAVKTEDDQVLKIDLAVKALQNQRANGASKSQREETKELIAALKAVMAQASAMREQLARARAELAEARARLDQEAKAMAELNRYNNAKNPPETVYSRQEKAFEMIRDAQRKIELNKMKALMDSQRRKKDDPKSQAEKAEEEKLVARAKEQLMIAKQEMEKAREDFVRSKGNTFDQQSSVAKRQFALAERMAAEVQLAEEKRKLKRAQSLFSQGFLPAESVDEAQAKVKEAEARLNVAQARLDAFKK